MSTENAVVHVIDDDEAVRDSLAFLLRAADIAVRTYDSATAFLDVAHGIEAGCVITDVRMPGLERDRPAAAAAMRPGSPCRSSSSRGMATFRSRSKP